MMWGTLKVAATRDAHTHGSHHNLHALHMPHKQQRHEPQLAHDRQQSSQARGAPPYHSVRCACGRPQGQVQTSIQTVLLVVQALVHAVLFAVVVAAAQAALQAVLGADLIRAYVAVRQCEAEANPKLETLLLRY